MDLLSIAAALIAVAVAAFIIGRIAPNSKAGQVVTQFETKAGAEVKSLEADAEADLVKFINAGLDKLADNSADRAEITKREASITARGQRVAAIKAKAASLPGA